MSKLRTKQILDFVTDVQAGMENYLTTAASNADAVVLSSAKSYADEAEADALSDAKDYTDARELVIEGEYSTADSVVLSDAKAYADDAESDAISSAKSYTDAREVVIEGEYSTADSVVLSSAKAYSDIQKGRIDILLENSDETLDTFKEISDFLGELDTTDISGLSAMISTGDSTTLSSAKSYTDARELIIEGEYSSADSVVLSDAKDYADQAEADAKAYTDERELVIEGEYSAADAVVLSEAKVYADGLVSGVDYREIDMKLLTVETFNSTTTFDMSPDAEVDLFINGLQIHRFDETEVDGEGTPNGHGWTSADGREFRIVNLGYTLDAVDHIIVSGKIA